LLVSGKYRLLFAGINTRLRNNTALLLPLPLPLLPPPFPEPYEAPRSVFFASHHSFLAPRELEIFFRTFSPRPANQCHPLRATGARRPRRRLKAENQSAEQTSEASTRSLTSVGDRYRVTVCLLRLATRAQHSKPSPVEHSF